MDFCFDSRTISYKADFSQGLLLHFILFNKRTRSYLNYMTALILLAIKKVTTDTKSNNNTERDEREG